MADETNSQQNSQQTKNQNEEQLEKPGFFKRLFLGLANILTLGLAGRIRKHLKENRIKLETMSDEEALKKEKDYIASQTSAPANPQPQVTKVSNEEIKEAQETQKQTEEKSNTVQNSEKEKVEQKAEDKSKEENSQSSNSQEEKQMQ